MVSGTWISLQQKGTIALRVYREISANQSVLHWGREAERGRRCLYCMDTHTLRCPYKHLLFCVLCLWGQWGILFWRCGRNNSAWLTRTWLLWKGGGNRIYSKSKYCLCMFTWEVSEQAERKDIGYYEKGPYNTQMNNYVGQKKWANHGLSILHNTILCVDEWDLSQSRLLPSKKKSLSE